MPRASTAISGTSADKQEEAIFQGIGELALSLLSCSALA